MSWKYKILKYIWKVLNINIISLVETQINKTLLDQTQDMSNNLFRGSNHFTIFSSNQNKLIGKWIQGRILTTIKGKSIKLIKRSGFDPINLGR